MTDLAARENQALSALLFLYRDVLGLEIPWADNVVRAKRPVKVPVVLSPDEVCRLFSYVDVTYRLQIKLLYGCGLRLMEVVRLRVKGLDFEYESIHIRDAKGSKDRVVMMPKTLMTLLREQLNRVTTLFEDDCADDVAGVYLLSRV